MAFIDVTVPYAAGNMSAQAGGAPSGGGITANAGASAAAGAAIGTPTGMHGPGGSGQLHHWVLAFYLFIGFTLISAGVIFNGKGRK